MAQHDERLVKAAIGPKADLSKLTSFIATDKFSTGRYCGQHVTKVDAVRTQ
jgi:hypothetical protein